MRDTGGFVFLGLLWVAVIYNMEEFLLKRATRVLEGI